VRNFPHIAVTAGEPAGIGVDLCVMLAQQPPPARITLIADHHVLSARAQMLGMPFMVPAYASAPDDQAQVPSISVMHVPATAPVQAGRLNPINSPYVLETLRLATDGCLAGRFEAMVTAPVHKGVINAAGIAFSGHTEFLADYTHTPHVVMMLVGKGLRIALATTHLPLREVSAAITLSSLTHTIRILHADLVHKFGITQPRIYIAGLNPHAGEGGYLGQEEIETINPVLTQLRADGMHLVGALPADTMFSQHNMAHADAFLAMYHDQGLPVLKYASFGEGVNVTLGLPMIRTSVDHGTALELVGTGQAKLGSLSAAIDLAATLANHTHV